MNLAEHEHTIRLVDPTAFDAEGQPHRHLLKIRMGAGAFDYQVGPNSVHIQLGGDFTVDENGTLTDSEGNVFDPRKFEQELVKQLNGHTAKLRSYAKKHGAPELKAAKGK